MNPNVLASEKVALIGTIDPVTVANTETFTDVIDMSKFHQVLAIAFLGDMAAETIDFKCYVCDSAGNNASAIKSATQLTGHATNNDNSQIIIGVRGEDLLPQTTYNRYVKFGLVTGGATGGPAAVAVLGVDAKYGPAVDHDLSSVKEVVNALD